MDVAKSGDNIQQKVFDLVPAPPANIGLRDLYAAMPFDNASILSALKRLRALKLVEMTPGQHFRYQRAKAAGRPLEGRGGKNRGAGRKRV